MLSSLSYPLRGLTIAYGSLDYVGKVTTFGKYVVRLCPLVSAYVRVLTFRRIILTVRLLHLASCSHYTWFILLNISYLYRGSLTPNPSPKGRGVITLKGVEAYLLEFNMNNYIKVSDLGRDGLKAQQAHSPGHRPGLRIAIVLTPC